MILGIVVAAGMNGCANPTQGLSPATTAAFVHDDRPRPAEAAARSELGDEAPAELVFEERPAPTPPDPGAEALVQAIVTDMPQRIVDERGETRIGLHYLRNQSRASAGEFDAFAQRLAELLTDAGTADSIQFTTDTDQPVHYQLLGTAYLVTAEGFDQWELFLRLSPADEAWTLWQSAVPVRVLRQARPGQPQITRWPLVRQSGE